MNDFYIELLSNASYITNTLAEFRNKITLLHPLQGDWEVGLSEISYTKSWYNLPRNSTLDLVFEGEKYVPYIDYTANSFVAFDRERSGTLKRGYYESVSFLVAEIEKELAFRRKNQAKVVENPRLFYDFGATKQIFIIPGLDSNKRKILPYIDQDLSRLLGFEYYDVEHPYINEQGLVVSQRPPDLTMGIRHLLVYCNLILPQYVGDSRTKLLRSIEIPKDTRFGGQVTLNYEKPHYLPILCNDFDEIEINIKDDVDAPIGFKFGRTRVKLHFRRK